MNGWELRAIALDVLKQAGYDIPFVIRVLPANLMPKAWGRHHRRGDGIHVIEIAKMPTATSYETGHALDSLANEILLHETSHMVVLEVYGEEADPHGSAWANVYGNLYRSWLQVCCRDDREW